MAPMFFEKGLCRLLTIDELDSGVLKEGKPERFHTIVQGPENNDYWRDLMESTKEQYLELWVESKGKTLCLPPTYAEIMLNITEKVQPGKGAQTSAPQPVIDIEKEDMLRALERRAKKALVPTISAAIKIIDIVLSRRVI